jgi:hypothetical protein
LTKVKELATAHGQANANLYLKAGWTLLKIDAPTSGLNFGDAFLMGWCQDGNAIHPEGITDPMAEFLEGAADFFSKRP